MMATQAQQQQPQQQQTLILYQRIATDLATRSFADLASPALAVDHLIELFETELRNAQNPPAAAVRYTDTDVVAWLHGFAELAFLVKRLGASAFDPRDVNWIAERVRPALADRAAALASSNGRPSTGFGSSLFQRLSSRLGATAPPASSAPVVPSTAVAVGGRGPRSMTKVTGAGSATTPVAAATTKKGRNGSGGGADVTAASKILVVQPAKGGARAGKRVSGNGPLGSGKPTQTTALMTAAYAKKMGQRGVDLTRVDGGGSTTRSSSGGASRKR
ncbi:hypothetical protein BC828DRAFT_378027 [Blastocladiella britannica]|nr:hypothetical protein BC828DRAFT_378027 [Blastocladiella britannica]